MHILVHIMVHNEVLGVGGNGIENLSSLLSSFTKDISTTWRINNSSLDRQQTFIKMLNEELFQYLVLGETQTQAIESLPIITECFILT